MVERSTGPTPVPSLRNCTGRHPDGDTVPQPPRHARQGMSRSERIGWTLAGVIVLILLVVGTLT